MRRLHDSSFQTDFSRKCKCWSVNELHLYIAEAKCCLYVCILCSLYRPSHFRHSHCYSAFLMGEQFPNWPFPWEDPGPHLISGSLGADPQSIWPLDQFSHLCRDHGCVQQTHRQSQRPCYIDSSWPCLMLCIAVRSNNKHSCSLSQTIIIWCSKICIVRIVFLCLLQVIFLHGLGDNG